MFRPADNRSLRRAITTLCIALCFISCQSQDDKIAEPAPAPEETVESVAAIEPVTVDSGEDKDLSVTVTVLPRVVNKANPLIFGTNLEWTHNGMGLYNPATKTWNPEAMALLRAIGYTHIRYPGGGNSDLFHWEQAIGDERQEQLLPWDIPHTGQMPNVGPDEFAAFCEDLMNARQTLTLNAGSGTPQEAADWVAYCKKKGYDVTNFAIGNEIWLEDRTDSKIYQTPAQYRDFYLDAYDRIQAAVPGTTVGTIAGYDMDDALGTLVKWPNWLEEVIKPIAHKTDFIDVHNAYAPLTRFQGMEFTNRKPDDVFAKAFAGQAVTFRRNLDELFAKLAELTGTHWENIDIAITEGGPLVYPVDPETPEDGQWNTTLVAALYQATLFHEMLKEPKIFMFNHMPFFQDVYAAPVGVTWDATGARATAIWQNIIYYVMQWYCAMAGRDVMDVNVSAPTYNAPAVGWMSPLTNVPYIDACAFHTREPDEELTVFLVNRDLNNARTVRLAHQFPGLEVTSVTVLGGRHYFERNTPAAPDNITPVELTHIPEGGEAKEFDITMPKAALVRVTMKPGVSEE